MVKKKIIDEAIELTKNIPSTDSNVSKNDFDNGTTCDNKENILAPLQSEEADLTPYPKVEYDVIMHYKLDKLIKDVNKKLEQGWQTKGGIQVSNGASVMYYQTLIRWNVDSGLKPEMPSKNSEAGTMGGNGPLGEGMKFLEEEEDLYEDVDKDGTTLQGE